MFNVEGFHIVRLTPEDAPQVQSLYERCNDYHLAHEGISTRASAGEEELTTLPPGRSMDDKFSFGIYAPGPELIGYLELFRNYPADGEWWIGLLMLDPKMRRRGLGSQIFRAASVWAAGNAAQAIQLGVLESDPAATSFWYRQGFEFVRRRAYKSQAERKSHTVLILRRLLSHRQSA